METYALIACHFTQSQWKPCTVQIEEMFKNIPRRDWCSPNLGLYVLRLANRGYWGAHDICEYLRRSDVAFVRVDFSTPLSGSLSEAGLKALADMDVEFWNKDG